MRKYDEDEALLFLTEQPPPWSGVLEDVLRQHEIPCFTSPVLGAGITSRIGTKWERFRFFVPAGRLAEARELVEELFSGEEIADE